MLPQLLSIIATGFLLWAVSSFPQTTAKVFAVASIKPSAQVLGRDRPPSRLVFLPAGVRGRNMTLKGLILEAYRLRPHQIIGGPEWLDTNEYEIDARSEGEAAPEELRLMLEALIKERFGFSFHRDMRQMTVYALVIDKGGPKIHPLPDSAAKGAVVFPGFRGDLQDLADLIGVQLSIPPQGLGADPAIPSVATGPPAPVVDSTGLPGIYEINLDLKPDLSRDVFTSWQRFLQEHCGLKLESRKSQVPVLVIDSVKKPTEN
jgi:uncharacterized protein (TIGR03435 family)